MASSLGSRKRDLVYFVFFVTHVPVMLGMYGVSVFFLLAFGWGGMEV